MTSPMHAPAGADVETEAAPTNLPLVSWGFARHASIARVCAAPRGLSGSPGPSVRNFAMICHRKPVWALCRICLVLLVPIPVDTGQQIVTEGKNRRRSMPESSLTEEAAIPRPVMPSPLASQSGTSAVLTSPEFRTARAVSRRHGASSPTRTAALAATRCLARVRTCSRSRNRPSSEIYARSSAAAGRFSCPGGRSNSSPAAPGCPLAQQ
jgi:hypothetical protein